MFLFLFGTSYPDGRDYMEEPLLPTKEPEHSLTTGPGEKRRSRIIVERCLGSHRMFLMSEMGRMGPIGDAFSPGDRVKTQTEQVYFDNMD